MNSWLDLVVCVVLGWLLVLALALFVSPWRDYRALSLAGVQTTGIVLSTNCSSATIRTTEADADRQLAQGMHDKGWQRIWIEGAILG